MNWDSKSNYFLAILVAFIVNNASGKYPPNFLKSYDPKTNVSLDIKQCNETRTRTEFRILQEASDFNATYKNVVIIIGLNGTDAVNLAKFLTNDNQTVLKSRIPMTGVEYSPNESAQQHLHQYFDKSEETAFYVHPGDSLKDDYLVDGFLAKKVIDNAEKIKIILTCRIIDGVDKIFKVAHNVLPNILKYKNHMMLVATHGNVFDGKLLPNQESVIDILENMSTMDNSTGEIAKFMINHTSYIEITSFNDLAGEQIKKYLRNLRFANSSITDFKYSLSINSTQKLRAICVCYYKPAFFITSGSLVIDDVISHLELIKNNTDRRNITQVRQYAKTMEKFYTYILSVYKEIENDLKTSHQFFNHIREMVKDLNFPLSEYSSRYIYSLQEPVYNYLFDIGQPVQLETDIWFHGFESFLNKFLPSHKYYEGFLKISDIYLSNATVDEQMTHRLNDMFTEIENVSLILEKNPFEVEAFESLKRSVYNRNVTIKCIRMSKKKKDYKVEVRGDIVSLSYLKNYTCQNVKYMEIFALNMVVIDVDLKLQNKKMEVAIVAPTWLILGNRTIDLSGTDGEKWKTVAKSGTTDGSKLGTHGKPGNPGASAGHFYAIAEKIINIRNLFVIAAGGKGGPGQDGGNGAKGDDGKSYEYNKDELEIRSGWKVAKGRPKEILSFPLQTSQYNVIFGKPGQRGGKGGNGGPGGEGGKGGDVKIVQLEENSNNFVKYFNPPGEEGAMGIGGKGGPGGVNGNNLHVAFVKTHLNYKHTTSSELKKNETQGNAPRGLNGITGGHYTRKIQAESVQKLQTFPRIVNNYKNYARENFDSSVRNDKLQKYYDLLNNNQEIIETYTVLDLIEEFLDLEKQFTTLANVAILFPSYESLLNRTEYYEKKIIRENTTSDDTIIPISSMKKDLERKTENNKKHGNYEPQFSMKQAYNMFMSNDMADVKAATIAKEFMDNYRETIKSIDTEIEEGRELVKVVQTFIDDVENELDRDIDALVKEVIKAGKSQNKKIEELTEETKRLEDSIQKKILFGIAKTICQSLAFINPVMGVVGTAATSVLNVVEEGNNVKANSSLTETLAVTIPKELSTDFKTAEDFLKEKKKAMEELIKNKEEILKQSMKSLPEKDVQVLKKWKSLGDLDNIKENMQPLSFSYKTLESNLESHKKEILEKAESEGYNYTGALNTIDKLKTVTKVSEVFGGIFKTVKEDQNLLKIVGKSIDQANKNLVTLRNFEDNIYSSISPILDSMKENLEIQGETFNKISKVRLTVVKWKIKNEIETVQRNMKLMLNDYKASEDFTWTLEKLIKAVQTLIDIHKETDELEKKKEDKKLMVNLHIISTQNIPEIWSIGDFRISETFAILKELYERNSFKRAYGEWLHAYKQFIFPKIENSLQFPAVFDASVRILRLENEIKRTKNVINRGQIFLTGEKKKFVHSPEPGSTPFAVWNNKKYAKQIGMFLSGEKVSFFANISNLQENAVKFNKIHLSFYSEDKTVLQNFMSDMKYFKVQLTHEGDSYYNCDGSTFLIRNSPTKIRIGYKTLSPSFDFQYLRLTNKDYVLSPYATWTMRLLNISLDKNVDDMSVYKGKIDLELTGNALVFENNACNIAKLSELYELVDRIP